MYCLNVKKNYRVVLVIGVKLGKVCKEKEKLESNSSEKCKWGESSMQVPRLTSSEPSLQKQVVSTT